MLTKVQYGMFALHTIMQGIQQEAVKSIQVYMLSIKFEKKNPTLLQESHCYQNSLQNVMFSTKRLRLLGCEITSCKY